jgi:hypothetical protein
LFFDQQLSSRRAIAAGWRCAETEEYCMRRLTIALVALIALAALIGPQAPAARAQTTNLVRVIHASPDAPAVDVFVNGQAVATNVTFFTASAYLPLADGTYQVAISPAGKGTDYSIFVGDLKVSGGYTGTLAAINTLKQLQVVLYDDNLSDVAGGNARVNVLHFSPDAPAVDIKLAGTSSAVFSNVPFSKGGAVEVPAGTYAFDISPAGSAAVAFTTPSLRFESGWIYTLFATGEIGKGGFWVQSRVDRAAAGISAKAFASGSAFGQLTSR